MTCPHCAELVTELRALEEANRALGESDERHAAVIGDLERDLRALRAARTRLENQLNDKDADDPYVEAANDLFEFWKQNCKPKAYAFKGKRRRAVLDRLKDGWQVGDLKDAVMGAAVGAFVDDKGVKHDDLELICRSDENVGKFIKRWEAHTQRVGDAVNPGPVDGPSFGEWEAELIRLETRIDSLEVAAAGVVRAAGGDWPERGSPYAPEVAVLRATLGFAVPSVRAGLSVIEGGRAA